ncbi:DNA repair exonuclease SbcCD nuclease subunit [Seinonella peptonophila]|uniref:DNA repair exonuclease SbcCD nuclease subunit n=1 Tax=Seinonella peptonophila TaxID=112248 RepID=A0A1M4WBM7_9BACL|nr:DNA repair exonuclease [Seinonella peptonophila]SHE78644.1 DNA repair exonuclease SbcCD nuclease subunit [Seinonella peptonophila]
MKPLRFIHTADLHLGKPLHHLSATESVYRRREKEYRQTFKRIIDQTIDQQVPFLLIAGDFVEHGYVDRSLWEFIQEQLCRLTDSTVFITPGNHDPYRADSIYVQEKWPDHVHIFTDEWGEFYDPEYDVQFIGKGFSDFYEQIGSLPHSFPNRGKQILIAHGELIFDDQKQSQYFPLLISKLEQLNFQYIALGHIHKPQTYQLKNDIETLIRYPGSPEALNWKETGIRTISIVQESSNGWIIEEIPIQTAIYMQIQLPMHGLLTKEQVLKRFLALHDNHSPSYTMLELTGMVSPELEMNQLIPWLYEELPNHKQSTFFIENQTLPHFDLDELKKKSQIIATYIELLEQKKQKVTGEDCEILELALLKGLEAFVRKERIG